MSYLPHSSISSAKISIRIVNPISISQHTLYHSLFCLPDINHKQEGGQNTTLPQPIIPIHSPALNPTQLKTHLILIIQPLNLSQHFTPISNLPHHPIICFNYIQNCPSILLCLSYPHLKNLSQYINRFHSTPTFSKSKLKITMYPSSLSVSSQPVFQDLSIQLHYKTL